MTKFTMKVQAVLAGLLLLGAGSVFAGPAAKGAAAKTSVKTGVAAVPASLAHPRSQAVLATLNAAIGPTINIPALPDPARKRDADVREALRQVLPHAASFEALGPGVIYIVDNQGREFIATPSSVREIDSQALLGKGKISALDLAEAGEAIGSYSGKKTEEGSALADFYEMRRRMVLARVDATVQVLRRSILDDEIALREAFEAGEPVRVDHGGMSMTVDLQPYGADYDQARGAYLAERAAKQEKSRRDATLGTEAFLAAGKWQAETYKLHKDLKARAAELKKESRKAGVSAADVPHGVAAEFRGVGGAAEFAGRKGDAAASVRAALRRTQDEIAALEAMNANLKPWYRRVLPKFGKGDRSDEVQVYEEDGATFARTHYGVMQKTEKGWEMVRPALPLGKNTTMEIIMRNIMSIVPWFYVPALLLGPSAGPASQAIGFTLMGLFAVMICGLFYMIYRYRTAGERPSSFEHMYNGKRYASDLDGAREVSEAGASDVHW